MYGMTVPRMSSEGTPGYPAPDTSCIVERNSCLMPNFWCSGARATAATVAEQLALVTMAPLHPRFLRWHSMGTGVPSVHFGEDERDVGPDPEVLRVAQDNLSRRRERQLDLARNDRVERR